MVSITIIGILFSIAMPIYEKTILKSRFENEAVITIKAISLAQEQYKIEVGKYYPYGFINANQVMYNGDQIAQNLKVDLTKTNNFLYGIEYLNDGVGYKVYAILRKSNVWGNDRCDDKNDSTRRCVQSLNDIDNWVKQYSRSINNHFITYIYPVAEENSVNGINYNDIYTGN